jgi:hypothetical protein
MEPLIYQTPYGLGPSQVVQKHFLFKIYEIMAWLSIVF